MKVRHFSLYVMLFFGIQCANAGLNSIKITVDIHPALEPPESAVLTVFQLHAPEISIPVLIDRNSRIVTNPSLDNQIANLGSLKRIVATGNEAVAIRDLDSKIATWQDVDTISGTRVLQKRPPIANEIAGSLSKSISVALTGLNTVSPPEDSGILLYEIDATGKLFLLGKLQFHKNDVTGQVQSENVDVTPGKTYGILNSSTHDFSFSYFGSVLPPHRSQPKSSDLRAKESSVSLTEIQELELLLHTPEIAPENIQFSGPIFYGDELFVVE
jgi:hypothetical protein